MVRLLLLSLVLSIDEDEDATTFQCSTFDADRQPSFVHGLPSANSFRPALDATLMPPPLSVPSPEPLWLPHFRARLDTLISVLVTSAFQLLWRPRDVTSVIKPGDLISHRQLRDNQQHRLHFLRRLVAIVFQEYTLLCISLAGSYESAAGDEALISQGRR
jgi:hypothetical protein